MSLQTKVHRDLESVATSALPGEPDKAAAANSPSPEEIRIRAHEIYMERGGEPGHDLDDWLKAERELEPKALPS